MTKRKILLPVGIVMGGIVLPALTGLSPFWGIFLGSQLSPLLAVVEGPRGDQLRSAGWASWTRFETFRARTSSFAAKIDKRYDLRGRWRRLDAGGKLRALDERFGLRAKAKALLQVLKSAARNVAVFLERRGVTARAKMLWRRTGIPRWWADFSQQQILRARMRDVEMREQQRGFNEFGL